MELDDLHIVDSAGETLQTEVEGIGRLENRCVAGPAYVSRTYGHVEPLPA